MNSVHTSHLLLLTFKYVAVLLFSITAWVMANLQDVKGIQRTTKTEVIFIMMNIKVPVPDLHSLLVWNIELVLRVYTDLCNFCNSLHRDYFYKWNTHFKMIEKCPLFSTHVLCTGRKAKPNTMRSSWDSNPFIKNVT